MKKLAMVLICAMVLSGLAIGSANATVANPGWFNVTVVSCNALPNFGFYSLVATSTDTPQGWTGTRIFLIDAGAGGTDVAGKTTLATVLTGYASGGTAALYLPNTQAEFTPVAGVGVGTIP